MELYLLPNAFLLALHIHTHTQTQTQTDTHTHTHTNTQRHTYVYFFTLMLNDHYHMSPLMGIAIDTNVLYLFPQQKNHHLAIFRHLLGVFMHLTLMATILYI
ncbi:hypothetical protein LOAG_13441 [Loa loa]|uniref:Uncharacterized protein n=1 Tax=Loa loa TaxID=7209 RepID=A0A1S0TJZ9_LOALO|nr:hypothetical protein LOAG_13441 [Loa loa]EFO15075.1 hypothetical protein LOAG_13441 [Loa loa]